MNWTYLGDGLYVAVQPDGCVVLRANGEEDFELKADGDDDITDESCPTVFLEPEVWASLMKWAVDKRVGQ